MSALSAPSSPPLAPARPVTLTAVARAAGVSIGAVSSFFSNRLYGQANGHGIGLGPDTRARIVTAARTLGYHPADPAHLVRLYPERGALCFLLDQRIKDGPANPYFGRILHGVSQRVTADGGHVSFAHYDPSVDYLAAPDRLPRILHDGSVTRCILAGQTNHALLLALQQKGLAVASCSRPVPAPGVTSLVPDYAHAAELALGHLFALGHRRVAVLAEHYFHPEAFNCRTLLEGTARAFATAALPWSTEHLHQSAQNGVWTPILRRLLDSPEPPSAVFCFDDWTAGGVLHAARELDLEVPRDLSVIGCNDDSRSHPRGPGLSTVHFPLEALGEAAINALATAEPAAPHRLITLPVSLVERATVAALAETSTHP